MIDIYSDEYSNKPKRSWQDTPKKTPKYKTIALEVMIWMRDNGVSYKTTDFYDRGYVLEGKRYSAEELFKRFMKEEGYER